MIAFGLAGNILLSVIILILMKASIRDEVGNWLSRNRLRIFSIPAVLLAINAVLLSLAGAWNAESFAHLSIYFLAPTVAIVLFRRSGCLIDILILGLLWLPVAFGLVQKNWKFSEYNYSLTALSAVIFAMVVFTTIRKLDFSMDWQLRWQDLKRVLIAYAILAIPLIVVTLSIGFTKFNPSKKFDWDSWRLAPELALFFTGLWFAPALVEEIVFRGIVQNTLVERLRPFFGILTASIIFGFSHIGQREGGYRFPNWPYVALATVAGVAYGTLFYVCKKRGSRNALAMAATLHAAVDFTWFVFLRNK